MPPIHTVGKLHIQIDAVRCEAGVRGGDRECGDRIEQRRVLPLLTLVVALVIVVGDL